jgi:CDP-diacylglycerol---serine O-phosphatidyltransferase
MDPATALWVRRIDSMSKPKLKLRQVSSPKAVSDSIDPIGVPVVPPPRKRARGIYILPNLFTTGNLFCGFFAIVQAMNGRFEQSAMAIFFAMILDSLDGRVARLTNTQSTFGEQYDSLADMVSFGAAPALVIYEFSLKGMGKLGWLAAFVYVAGAALRLARFNANLGVVDKKYFQGLASPAAAALVAGFVWLVIDNRSGIPLERNEINLLAAGFTLYAGLTMVSNAPFYSFKDINLRKAVPFTFALLIVLGFVVISFDVPIALFILFLGYAFSGWFVWLYRKRKPAV